MNNMNIKHITKDKVKIYYDDNHIKLDPSDILDKLMIELLKKDDEVLELKRKNKQLNYQNKKLTRRYNKIYNELTELEEELDI